MKISTRNMWVSPKNQVKEIMLVVEEIEEDWFDIHKVLPNE